MKSKENYMSMIRNQWRGKSMRYLNVFAVSLLMIFASISCEKGEIGEPGLAFVAFTWVDHEPEYIEIANDFIPATFYWDWYYRVEPGIYYVYYEGIYRRSPYAWELEYEVWENEGKRGKHAWVKGPDGPDAYFTIELSPFGPEVIYEEVYLDKSGAGFGNHTIIPEIGSSYVVEKQNKDYNLRLRYNRVEPRSKSLN